MYHSITGRGASVSKRSTMCLALTQQTDRTDDGQTDRQNRQRNSRAVK